MYHACFCPAGQNYIDRVPSLGYHRRRGTTSHYTGSYKTSIMLIQAYLPKNNYDPIDQTSHSISLLTCYHQDRNSRNEADDCTQYPWNSLHQATRHHRMYGMTTTGHRSDLRILFSPNRRSRYDYIKKSGAGFVPHTTSLSSSCFRGQCRVYRPK
jgi:hypothetical protein